jgi:two-component system, OmpR family, heavy metal sensor histidine kinase CusS
VRLSIRWRLTLWNTLALTVVLLSFAAMVYCLLRHALYEQLDNRLLAAWQVMEQDHRLKADADDRLRYWATELYEHHGIFTIVYAANGQVRLRTPELAEASVPAAPATPVAAPVRVDLAVPALGRQRVLDGRLGVGDQVRLVRLMNSLADVDHELAELLTAVFLAVPVALAFAGAIGYLLARKALAPVEQLRRQTREVTVDRLDRRLPVAHPADELGRLAETINDMIGRLERSFTEIRRFTADASHELRTPLTALRAEIEVALRQPAVPEDQQRLLGSVLEECQRLTRLTDQLLALSREDAGVAPRADEPLDLAALVSDAAETMRPLAEEKGLRLLVTCAGPLALGGDDARLRQVVYNLLENAIKYTPAGGEVEVQVQERDGTAVVTVRDSGIGIPVEHLPRVFDRFYRVDKARSREQGGTGLGLSIAQSIVAAHGGSITLESAVGQGTACTVTLPRTADLRHGKAEG